MPTPRRKRVVQPDDSNSRYGSYGFRAYDLKPGAPDGQTTFTMDITMPESAIIQHALGGLIDAMKGLLPPEMKVILESGGSVALANVDSDQRYALALLTVATEAMHLFVTQTYPMKFGLGPDGSFGVIVGTPSNKPASN